MPVDPRLIHRHHASKRGAKTRSKLEGMWGDPSSGILRSFCFMVCTEVGLARLNALLDDPANDEHPFQELLTKAREQERDYISAQLTPDALKTYPMNPTEDPGFARCEPWGVGRQMFAPHQFEIRQHGNDVIELRYGEWDARRTIYMNADKRRANPQPSRMGYSVGHWEGDALVIETSHIAPNLMLWTDLNHLARHSDQLHIRERYVRSEDGKALELTATIEDAWSLREPLVVKKMWRWSPESEIDPYKDCQIPTNLLKKE